MGFVAPLPSHLLFKAFLSNGDDKQCVPDYPPPPTFLMPSFFCKGEFADAVTATG